MFDTFTTDDGAQYTMRKPTAKELTQGVPTEAYVLEGAIKLYVALTVTGKGRQRIPNKGGMRGARAYFQAIETDVEYVAGEPGHWAIVGRMPHSDAPKVRGFVTPSPFDA